MTPSQLDGLIREHNLAHDPKRQRGREATESDMAMIRKLSQGG